MRIGDELAPPPAPPARRTLAEDLFAAVSAAYRGASMSTKIAAGAALERGDFKAAPQTVKAMFAAVAEAFADS